MISILLPTRNRPANIKRFLESLAQTISAVQEVVFYVDDDDVFSVPMIEHFQEKMKTGIMIKYIVGPRITMTDYWNKCYEQASGEIMMQAGDDIIFKTKAWDSMVENTFRISPDKILLVHGDDMDGNFRSNFGTHSFLHRNWIDALGYFIPPYFSSDNGDRWLMEVADFIGRRKFIPIVTEHIHPRTGKVGLDSTYKERLARHERDNPNQLYVDMFYERLGDAAKLQARIEELRNAA